MREYTISIGEWESKRMLKRDLNFFESYEFMVEFNFDDTGFTGVLSINLAGIPQLKIHTENHSLQFAVCRTKNN